jgi:hypothetical protein
MYYAIRMAIELDDGSFSLTLSGFIQRSVRSSRVSAFFLMSRSDLYLAVILYVLCTPENI